MNEMGFSHVYAKPPLTAEETAFGDQIPFGDPYWYQGGHSPYYHAGHLAWRAKCREFVERELVPKVEEWEDQALTNYEQVAKEQKVLYRKSYEEGILGATFPQKHGGTPPQDFDIFHELIYLDEFGRCGSWGVTMAAGILTMALPPVILAATEDVKKRGVIEECVRFEKQIALCISEPTAGSDVANIRTSAVREGDTYLINGEKKWITNGVNADYFTVLCRTGEAGNKGLSLILVERKPGVKTEKLPMQGNWTAGTAFVTFEDVRVPVSNLIGKENDGFRLTVQNFNHERFVIAAQGIRAARVCLEECVRHARRRKTFGKNLIEHQVIRHKIGDMARKIESTHAWLEQIAYQIKTQAPPEKLGQLTALLKVQMSETYKFVALQSAQIFGGAAYVRGGTGAKVERAIRDMVAAAIPGGSEEIMIDLAMRMAKL